MNICLSCGACCAFYRVAFPAAETDDRLGGHVPGHLTVPVDAMRRAMMGIGKKRFRCAALVGNIGTRVRCDIYECRPSVCRAFRISWENDLPNPLCERARALYGLAPISQYF